MQASNIYNGGCTSLEEYISSLKSIVGLDTLVEAVGIEARARGRDVDPDLASKRPKGNPIPNKEKGKESTNKATNLPKLSVTPPAPPSTRPAPAAAPSTTRRILIQRKQEDSKETLSQPVVTILLCFAFKLLLGGFVSFIYLPFLTNVLQALIPQTSKSRTTTPTSRATTTVPTVQQDDPHHSEECNIEGFSDDDNEDNEVVDDNQGPEDGNVDKGNDEDENIANDHGLSSQNIEQILNAPNILDTQEVPPITMPSCIEVGISSVSPTPSPHIYNPFDMQPDGFNVSFPTPRTNPSPISSGMETTTIQSSKAEAMVSKGSKSPKPVKEKRSKTLVRRPPQPYTLQPTTSVEDSVGALKNLVCHTFDNMLEDSGLLNSAFTTSGSILNYRLPLEMRLNVAQVCSFLHDLRERGPNIVNSIVVKVGESTQDNLAAEASFLIPECEEVVEAINSTLSPYENSVAAKKELAETWITFKDLL
ncbi:hypothetical protein RIF29_24470 [Crotalaria pallida]|uniref:Uncharacterized protein n=1 Tax=Crotalaria pallida TaxID=3830 RepID=A0AAN9I3A0_CROPI